MENKSDIILTVGIGTAVFLVMIMAIIVFVVMYNRKIREKEAAHRLEIKSKELDLLKVAIKTQEVEREVLAANLHDEVGPLLSALKLRLTLYKRKLQKQELDLATLQQEDEYIDQIINNVRTVSHELSPHFVNKFGLYQATLNYVNNIKTPAIKFSGENLEKLKLDKQVAGDIYRILLELINNILKHDSPSWMDINWRYSSESPDKLDIAISHDGNGMSNEDFEKYLEASKGIGLSSIKSRQILLNAILVFKEKEDNKASVTLTVPLK